jgi:hypothetical protein
MTFNVLIPAMAATAILGCNKKFQYLKYLRTGIDDMGRAVPEFDEPVSYTGSIQAVPNRLYEQLGLDLDKNYKTVFCPQLMRSLAEEIQPDRIVYENRTFEIVENKNWYETNGYTRVLMVELKELRNESDNNQIQDEEPNI